MTVHAFLSSDVEDHLWVVVLRDAYREPGFFLDRASSLYYVSLSQSKKFSMKPLKFDFR